VTCVIAYNTDVYQKVTNLYIPKFQKTKRTLDPYMYKHLY